MEKADNAGAWAPFNQNQTLEYLIVEFEHYYKISGIKIFETFHPGAVVKIACLPRGKDQYNRCITGSVKGSTVFQSNDWVTLYEGPPRQSQHQDEKANIFTPPLAQGFESKILAIHMNTYQSASWSEIDAIELIGIPTEDLSIRKQLWVGGIVAVSSEYPGWSASNIIGPINVYPSYGDIRRAWAPATAKGTSEFLTLDFLQEMWLQKVEIYETFTPGALVRVTAYRNHPNSGDMGQVIYQGNVELNLPAMSRIKEIPIQQQLQFPVRYLRLDMDTSNQTGFYEIDAVRITGLN